MLLILSAIEVVLIGVGREPPVLCLLRCSVHFAAVLDMCCELDAHRKEPKSNKTTTKTDDDNLGDV